MNDPELRNLLHQHRLPDADESVAHRALDRALTTYRNRSVEREPKPTDKFSALWIFAAGCACALVLVCFLPKSQKPQDSAGLFAELEGLFPGQLSGIVLQDGEVDLLLSENTQSRPADQRVAVEVSGGSSAIEVLTYSGNMVCIAVGDEKVCMTPLISGRDGVFVLTEKPMPGDSLKVSAHKIEG